MAKRKPNPLKPKKISNYQRGPLWDWTKGVTQSSLETFLACREQFSLGYIEGWTAKQFSVPLEFGTLIHFMLERLPGEPHAIAREVCQSYEKARKKTLNSSDMQTMEITLCNAEAIFPVYCEYWEEMDSKIDWIQRESIFKIKHPFMVPGEGTRSIDLTGMRDAVYRNSVKKLGLFETKTKSSIDDLAIQDGLRADLQTLLYLYSLWRDFKEYPQEILYNVIRRPQLRLKVKESVQEYKTRVSEDIKERPNFYFRRFEVTVIEGDLETFIDTTLDPVLRQLLLWWESIKDDPFDRWRSPYHYRDLTKLMNRYGKVPLYNLMIWGLQNEYYRRSSPFPELEKSLMLQEA